MAVALEIGEVEYFLHCLPVRCFRRAHAAREESFGDQVGVDPRVARHQEIFDHGEMREQFAVLKGPGDAEARYAVRRHLREVVRAEGDLAAAGPVETADAVEDRGFAGAVRPDQAQQFAVARLE